MSSTTDFTGDPVEAAPRGFRWWRVSPDGELYSAWFDRAWDPASNEATCAIPVTRVSRRAWSKRHAAGVPAPGCTCGFYALHGVPYQHASEPEPERPWQLDPEEWSGLGASVVFGVAEAWGRVLVGTEGWRSRYSRALALYVPNGSDLWGSDRMRLVAARYGIPVTASLEGMVAEWAPEREDGEEPSAIFPPGTTFDVPMGGGDARTDASEPRRPDRWHDVTRPDAPRHERVAREADRAVGSDPASPMRVALHAATFERLVGAGSKRVLELGPGAGHRFSTLSERGHTVVAATDEVVLSTLPGPFDVVYVGGFGGGTDDEQRTLLRAVGRCLDVAGVALVEVATPWYGASMQPRSEALAQTNADVAERTFDADGCRLDLGGSPVSPLWNEFDRAGALRCYSPADLRLLVEGTGLEVDEVEPYPVDDFAAVATLESAKFYLARLIWRG